MSGLSDGKMRLNDSKPPTTSSTHAWYVKMSYRTLPLVAGFLPVLPEARGANVCAMFFTLLSVDTLLGWADVVVVAASDLLGASAIPYSSCLQVWEEILNYLTPEWQKIPSRLWRQC